MRSNYTRPTKDQVEWRRLKTQELMIKGNSPLEICSVLKVSHQVVHRDIRILREVRKNIQTHLEDRLPHEYENCMAGINQVLKMSWGIATGTIGTDNNPNSNNTTSTVLDDRTRLQPVALANDY